MSEIINMLARLDERLSRIEAALSENKPSIQMEWYAVSSVAEILWKAPFTVREWCRNSRVNAVKRPSGRGRSAEWMISHKELERIVNKGLLPPDF